MASDSLMADLPTVDLYACPDDAALAQAIGAAIEKTGQVCLTNTGFDQQLITELWVTARSFFALPVEVKSQYRMEFPPVDWSSGYSGFSRTHQCGEMEDASENLLDKDHEAFDFFPHLIKMRWPDDQMSPGFITKFRSFCDGCLELSWKIQDSLSLFWKKDPSSVRSALYSGIMGDPSRDNITGGRLNYYGPLTGNENIGAKRHTAHRDYHMFTLLWPRGQGLQVLQNGEWKDVPSPPPGGVLLQGGTVLEIITNNRMLAPMHRVVVPPGATEEERRTSSVYFFSPDNQYPMVPLDGDATGADTYQDHVQESFGGKY